MYYLLKKSTGAILIISVGTHLSWSFIPVATVPNPTSDSYWIICQIVSVALYMAMDILYPIEHFSGNMDSHFCLIICQQCLDNIGTPNWRSHAS